MNELTTLPGPVWGCELIGSPLILAGVYNSVAPVLSDGDVCALQVDVNGKLITSGGGGGSTAFSAITSGTNTAAAMVVGSGASLGVSGTGLITGPFTSATANPATVGMLRLANADTIAWRTNNNTNNVTVFVDVNNNIHFNDFPTMFTQETVINGGRFSIEDSAGNTTFYRVSATGLVSIYNQIPTVSNGVPTEYATVDLTGQVAAITTTPLYTPTATGLFRISAYAKVTTAAATASLGGSTGLTLGYTDGDDSVAQTLVMDMASQTGSSVITNPNSTTASKLVGSSVIFAKTGVAITYAFDYSSSVGTMAYSLHLKVEAL